MGGIKDQNMGNADLNLENRIHAFSIWVVSEPWNGWCHWWFSFMSIFHVILPGYAIPLRWLFCVVFHCLILQISVGYFAVCYIVLGCFSILGSSFLHQWQYNGKWISTVSSRIFVLVFLPQDGHFNQNVSLITIHPSSCSDHSASRVWLSLLCDSRYKSINCRDSASCVRRWQKRNPK